jgi:hypothetical protein
MTATTGVETYDLLLSYLESIFKPRQGGEGRDRNPDWGENQFWISLKFSQNAV